MESVPAAFAGFSAVLAAGTAGGCGAETAGADDAAGLEAEAAGGTAESAVRAGRAKSAVPATVEVSADCFNKSTLEEGASTAVETRKEDDADEVAAACPQTCPATITLTASPKSFFMCAPGIRYSSTLVPEPLSSMW